MTQFVVDESDRGPEIPEARLDLDAYVTLAAAVINRAMEDLGFRPYRSAARKFLLWDLPMGRTIWGDFFSNGPNRQMLRQVVAQRCAQRARLKGFKA